MQMGKVIGTVVSTSKDQKLEGLKLLIVEYVKTSGEPTGNLVVAVDAVGAGIGEIVLVSAGSSARLTPVTEGKPVDAVIMAIVDTLEVGGDTRYQK